MYPVSFVVFDALTINVLRTLDIGLKGIAHVHTVWIRAENCGGRRRASHGRGDSTVYICSLTDVDK
jgi:hypothetical protein